MMFLAWVSNAFLLLGVFFFITSVTGLLRFPDTLCRMHALAKADNLALGCVIVGAILRQDDPLSMGKLLLIWGVTLLSSATSAFLLARRIRRGQLAGDRPS
jgi:multicomponent Na+:H+ antiporter subunit G